MIKWRPDTCDCVFGYDMENDHPVLKKIFNMCSAHNSLSFGDLLAKILQENRLKNEFFGTIQDTIADFKLEDYKWSFDNTRKLNVDVTGIQGGNKNIIKTLGNLDKFKDKVNFNG